MMAKAGNCCSETSGLRRTMLVQKQEAPNARLCHENNGGRTTIPSTGLRNFVIGYGWMSGTTESHAFSHRGPTPL